MPLLAESVKCLNVAGMLPRTQDTIEERERTRRLGMMALTVAARANCMSLVPGRSAICPGLAVVPS
jgi:hypothetical protein